MNTLNVDIYYTDDKRKRKKQKHDNNNIRLVLRGQAEGKIRFTDYTAFTTFVEECKAFISNYTPIPAAFLDAFEK